MNKEAREILDFYNYINKRVLDIGIDETVYDSKFILILDNRICRIPWDATIVNGVTNTIEEVLEEGYDVFVKGEHIRSTYDDSEDITAIWKEDYKNGHIISKEVIGWYHGKPNSTATEQCIGKLKAEYLM